MSQLTHGQQLQRQRRPDRFREFASPMTTAQMEQELQQIDQ
jgi:hypothetical protein